MSTCTEFGCTRRGSKTRENRCLKHYIQTFWSFDQARRGAETLSRRVGPWMVVRLPEDCKIQQQARSVGLVAWADYSTHYREEMAGRIAEVYVGGERTEVTEVAP